MDSSYAYTKLSYAYTESSYTYTELSYAYTEPSYAYTKPSYTYTEPFPQGGRWRGRGMPCPSGRPRSQRGVCWVRERPARMQL